ncbi:hypothetical protein ACFLYR_02485 [Chloroflexota bacterium]
MQKQWAVFEAMIALMTPQGFADLMGSMWPELIDAMPFRMGPMMMPKVMSIMLQRVAERIPMPDYMREQMPDLMPNVMGNLMPHMIGDVVPLITEPMINYLRGNREKQTAE